MTNPKQNAVLKTLKKDVMNVQVKWYVGIILLSAAAILFLYKGSRRKH